MWLVVMCGLAAHVHFYGRVDYSAPADVIVVLGAGLHRNNTPAPALMRRSQHAADLYARGIAPVIICTGGVAIGRTRSEADGCREILEAAGVPRAAIWMETRSRSTEENALYTEAIMRAHGWARAVVVSDNYHLLRAHWLFDNVGLEVATSPSTLPQRISSYWLAVGREIVALHWQVLKQMLNLPFTYVPAL